MLIPRERMKLVNGDAESIFGSATPVNGSAVLCAFLRAIIIKHTEWDVDSVDKGSKVGAFDIKRTSDVESRFNDATYAVSICYAAGIEMDAVKPTEGWTELNNAPFPVGRYLSQYIPTRLFINLAEKRTVIFAERRVSNRWLQAFMSVIPRVMTWYFPSVISAEDRELCKAISAENKSISEDEAKNYLVEYINSAAAIVDIRTLLLHKRLDGYADIHRQGMIKETTERIESLHNAIQDYARRLGGYYRDLDSEVIKLRGLQMAEVENSDALFEFFNSHKQLTVLSANESGIEFGVGDTLEFFDEEEFEAIVENKHSYLYDYANDELISALKAIFLEHKAVFYTNAVFKMSAMNLVSPRQGETFIYDAMPQPHIYFYGCSGGHEQYYTEYAAKGEWQLAIEQSIAATKNINFGDHTVGGRMVRWIRDNRDTKCLKMPGNDVLVCMDEFIEIMKEGE